MELARYYAFFNQMSLAYRLAKKAVFRSPLRADRIFFLKMIWYMDCNLTEKTRIQYFRRMKTLVGDEFCTYFNSPDLNFQILNHPEILIFIAKPASRL